MAYKINRICPFCGKKMYIDTYKNMRNPKVQGIAYCDNDNCSVKPCTDADIPSKVYLEILAITGDAN